MGWPKPRRQNFAFTRKTVNNGVPPEFLAWHAQNPELSKELALSVFRQRAWQRHRSDRPYPGGLIGVALPFDKDRITSREQFEAWVSDNPDIVAQWAMYAARVYGYPKHASRYSEANANALDTQDAIASRGIEGTQADDVAG